MSILRNAPWQWMDEAIPEEEGKYSICRGDLEINAGFFWISDREGEWFVYDHCGYGVSPEGVPLSDYLVRPKSFKWVRLH